MAITTSGLHHVTAIAGNPQRNADFYLRTLGLRLVKSTVNFDDPGTYHLYYGDAAGRPGSLITFFPWPGAGSGRQGAGQVTTTAFSVPENSLGWWRDHLDRAGVATELTRQGDEEVLAFRDPDGLSLALVAHPQGDPREPWDTPSVPAEHAVRGLHSTTMTVAQEEPTALVLGDLGLTPDGRDGQRFRFSAGAGGPGACVDVHVDPNAQRGLTSVGTVHHVAWRAPDREVQNTWRRELVETGFEVTAVLDRQYFRSIYFREPGGVLLEIATDEPGFTADEPLLELGRSLKLPPWLEPDRAQIEAKLPELNLPSENNPGVTAS